MTRILLMLALLPFLAGCGSARETVPDQGTPADDARGESMASRSGELKVYGALRAMMHAGQRSATITLEGLLPNRRLYAVGALAGLAGEVTIVGGQAYLSYPDPEGGARTEETTESSAGAALLVTAEVDRWISVETENSIPFGELDQAVGSLAAAAGLAPDARFPFLIRGRLEDLQWHVIDGGRLPAGASSHQGHLAASVRRDLDEASATLVGFYSPRDGGVFTHMGSKTHIHCVIEDPLAAGHVDSVVVPAGTVVMFPASGQDEDSPAPSAASAAD